MELKEAYKVMQAAWVKENDIEVGDKVRAFRRFKLNEMGGDYYFGSNGNNYKQQFVDGNVVGTVKSFTDGCVNVDLGHDLCGNWSLPFFVLELVEKAKKPCVTVTKMVTVKDKVYSEDTVQLALEQYVKGD